jgi:UPF0716 protein FxsA
MVAFLALLFLLIPVAEIAVLIKVGSLIGVFPTLALLIVVSVIGAVMAKREGLAVWRRLRATVARGEIPSSELVDGALVLLGGSLLVAPGFLTDVVGIVLLLPLTRPAVKRLAMKAARATALRRLGLARPVPRSSARVRVISVDEGRTDRAGQDRPSTSSSR